MRVLVRLRQLQEAATPLEMANEVKAVRKAKGELGAKPSRVQGLFESRGAGDQDARGGEQTAGELFFIQGPDLGQRGGKMVRGGLT